MCAPGLVQHQLAAAQHSSGVPDYTCADVCLPICLLQYMPFSIEDRIKEEGALYTKASLNAAMPCVELEASDNSMRASCMSGGTG